MLDDSHQPPSASLREGGSSMNDEMRSISQGVFAAIGFTKRRQTNWSPLAEGTWGAVGQAGTPARRVPRGNRFGQRLRGAYATAKACPVPVVDAPTLPTFAPGRSAAGPRSGSSRQ